MSPFQKFWLYPLISDCVPPFNVQIYTDASAYAIAATQRGVCLEYEQVPCGAGG